MSNQNFFSNLSESIHTELSNKGVGFYIGLVGAVCAIVGGILSGVHYAMTEYYNVWSVVLPIVGGALYLLLSLHPLTVPCAAPVLFAGSLAGFVMFIDGTYMYLSDVFYGGFSAQTLASLDGVFILCFVLFLLGTVCGNIGWYVKSGKTPVDGEKRREEKAV